MRWDRYETTLTTIQTWLAVVEDQEIQDQNQLDLIQAEFETYSNLEADSNIGFYQALDIVPLTDEEVQRRLQAQFEERMSRLEAKLKTTSVNKQGKQSIAEIEKSLERMKTVLEDGQLMSEEEMLTGLNKLNFLLKTTNQHSITLQQISSTDLVMIERIGLARRDLETLKQRIQQIGRAHV